MVWVAALSGGPPVGLGDLRSVLADYPMPKDTRAALAGSRKLGLVTVDGNTAQLTDAGRAVAKLLPVDLLEWAAIHNDIASARRQVTLAERAPHIAAVLRLLLLGDPLVQHLVDGLRRLPPAGGNLVQLAQACSSLDRAKARILFMKPEAVPAHDNGPGKAIDWLKVPPHDFRSTTFFQYKSVLRHAGILGRQALGAASTRAYEPMEDMWQLGSEMLF